MGHSGEESQQTVSLILQTAEPQPADCQPSVSMAEIGCRLLEKVILSSDGNFLAQIVRETQIVPLLLPPDPGPSHEGEEE